MEKQTALAVVSIGFFAAVVLSIFFIMKYRYITLPNTMGFNVDRKKKSNWQKPGIVVIGIGIGVLIFGLLHDYTDLDNDAINVGIIAICAGISMIVANYLDKDKSSED